MFIRLDEAYLKQTKRGWSIPATMLIPLPDPSPLYMAARVLRMGVQYQMPVNGYYQVDEKLLKALFKAIPGD